jgi:hypothetical protein
MLTPACVPDACAFLSSSSSSRKKRDVLGHIHTQTLKTKKHQQQEEQEQGRWNLGIHELFFSKSAHEGNLITSTCLCVFVFLKFFY